jgi:hypothetical protein
MLATVFDGMLDEYRFTIHLSRSNGGEGLRHQVD